MRLSKLIMSAFLSILFWANIPSEVFALSDTDWLIEDFNVKIKVDSDTTVNVVETIHVDFGNVAKHGIIREIPVKYNTNFGNSVDVRFNLEGVFDEEGAVYPVSSSRSGKNINLKIGDPSFTVTGENIYEIKYQVKQVLQTYDDQVELYWNVTGNNWPVKIGNASVEVRTGENIILRTTCFTGGYGSSQSNCTQSSKDTYSEFEARGLKPFEGLTIVLGMDSSNFVFPSGFEKIYLFLLSNWGFLFSFLPLISISFVWWKKGRDKRYLSDMIYYTPDDKNERNVSIFERKHISTVYHPIDGLSPSEVGTIIDEKVDIHDVIAEILELSRLKYITIQKFEKKGFLKKIPEYAFIKTKKYNSKKEFEKLNDYQQYLLKELFRSTSIHKSVKKAEKIFSKNDAELTKVWHKMAKKEYVLLSALKNHFYEGLSVYKEKLYKRMENEEYFAGDPEKVRQRWMGGFLLFDFFGGFFIFVSFISLQNFWPFVLLGIFSIPGFLVARAIPRRTAKGYAYYRQIEGLYYYLQKGKWRHEVAEKEMFINEMIPLAVSLGVLDSLADDMKDLELSPPDYFAGSSIDGFVADIARFQSSASQTLVSRPGGSSASGWSGGSGFSSGGGFSGGGMGGGGGGSW